MRRRRPLPVPVVPIALCLVLGALGGVGTALVTSPAPAQPARFIPPRVAPPAFRLRDQDGRWATPRDARGQVLVISFVYSRCRDLCPRQAAEIRDAVVAAGKGVTVDVITVDPEHDTAADARAWLRRLGVAGGPVRYLLGTRRELTPVWSRFGIVPLPAPAGAADDAEFEKYAARRAPLAGRPPPAAALDPYPAAGDQRFRGRPRHHAGADYEHSAYALLVDKRGRQRVGFPFEQITTARLLADLRVLQAER